MSGLLLTKNGYSPYSLNLSSEHEKAEDQPVFPGDDWNACKDPKFATNWDKDIKTGLKLHQ